MELQIRTNLSLFFAFVAASLTIFFNGCSMQILIIDQFDRFVFKPMMYELLSKEVDIWEIAPRFEDLLKGTNIKFQQDRVKKVFPYKISSSLSNGSFTSEDIGGCVALESGLEVEYDW
ncbi:hypothetical protein KP509_1Z321400 [Ceratopteris richardii]|nr:hypothetical protein KP509_1Z321400 [Ceratopteris richardii]